MCLRPDDGDGRWKKGERTLSDHDFFFFDDDLAYIVSGSSFSLGMREDEEATGGRRRSGGGEGGVEGSSGGGGRCGRTSLSMRNLVCIDRVEVVDGETGRAYPATEFQSCSGQRGEGLRRRTDILSPLIPSPPSLDGATLSAFKYCIPPSRLPVPPKSSANADVNVSLPSSTSWRIFGETVTVSTRVILSFIPGGSASR